MKALPITQPQTHRPHDRAMLMTNEDQREFDGLLRLDSQVISAIYDRYFPSVYRYARYRINDETHAEDIASDVFVRLLEAIRDGRGPETNLKAWLLTTASHAVNDFHRKTYRRPTDELSDNLADKSENLADNVEQRERHAKVRQALSGLTPEQQHVLALRFSEGLSLEETANMMKKNVNAIKQLQLRALAALNRKVGEAL
jgi:RNA polymerase sigma-70 factor (ECF subfamily)